MTEPHADCDFWDLVDTVDMVNKVHRKYVQEHIKTPQAREEALMARPTGSEGLGKATDHILAIDPGEIQTGWCYYSTELSRPVEYQITENNEMLSIVSAFYQPTVEMWIEMPQCYGMGVGKSVFETAYWVGRFVERWRRKNGRYTRVKRTDVKHFLCHTNKCGDTQVNQALRDIYSARFGLPVKNLKGTKKEPGPLYGMAKDMWAALAIAEYAVGGGRS